MELSATEQQLIDFAQKQFGEPLTRFLLAGLGEEDAGREWQFTIIYTGDEGVTLERRVQVLSYEPDDGSSYLPRQRDPLVLLALLKLLTGDGQPSQHSLLYDRVDVLNLLGWGDTLEARHEIDGAVDRYSLMMFKWEMNSAELVKDNLSRHAAMECLISEYGIIDEGETGNGHVRRVRNRVVFDANFTERLKQRSLFGIDWNKVRSLKLGNG